jgi:hypothetical protein
MAFRLPNGANMEIAASFSALALVTAISNANPAVATSAAHSFEDGDVVVITSGWSRLNERAVRVIDSLAGTFALEGVSTVNSQIYTAGGGGGSARSVDSWVQIPQITEVASTGGEQQFLTVGFLEDDEDKQIPTNKNPISMTLTVADDPTLPYVPVVEAADEDKEARVLRLNLPDGSSILYNAFVSITSTPTLGRNALMTRTITISLTSRIARYMAA